MIMLIWGMAAWREWRVEVGPPVMIRLPLAVHLTVASCICGRDIQLNFLLRDQQSTSSFTWFPLSLLNLARSTTRLGLGGLDPAIAE